MPSAVFKSIFDAEIVRHKADKTTFTFKTRVQGQFESKGEKPIFTIVAITVEGMSEMSLSSFLPAELSRVKEYALEEVYPQLLGIKNDHDKKLQWRGSDSGCPPRGLACPLVASEAGRQFASA